MPDYKSYERFLLGLYSAMFSDIVSRCPSLRVDCERDYKRLLSAVEQHGLHFITAVLPAFGKHFDTCLANERLTPSELCHFGRFKRSVVIPRLFKGLLLRVFDSDGVLRSDPDTYAIACVRQLCQVAKRLEMKCDPHYTWEQVNEFIQTDGEIVQPTLNWYSGDFDSQLARTLQFGDCDGRLPPPAPLFGECGDGPVSSDRWWFLCSKTQRVADIVASTLGVFRSTDWKPRHGPGAVSDLRSGEYKYSFPNWSDRLERAFPMADLAFANYAHWIESLSNEAGGFVNNDPPSRLIAVPKSFTGPRLIAAEPTSAQWCQQIIRDYFVARLRATPISRSIKFDDQTWNGRLAMAASRTGSHATIDLSSASDRISCWVVERLFRANPSLLEALYSSRSMWLKQDIDRKSPAFIRLRKFSTMGSAVTFPVQSILFTVLAVSALLYEEDLPATIENVEWASRRVRVFGDDIIVPSTCYDTTVELLTTFGLKVNHQKTFATGRFRESCGCDAYNGVDVTPARVTSVPRVSAPGSVLGTVDVHNNFFMRGWFGTATYLRRSVDLLKRYRFMENEPGSGGIGWYSFDGEGNRLLKRRWNPSLQRREYLVCQPCGQAQKVPLSTNSMVLQYFTEVTRPPRGSEVRLGSSPLRHPLKLRWVWAPA